MHNLIAPDFLYAVPGFCVGALVGMTEVGGGSLLTPLLILLFGVHPTTAVGTDLLFAASTKATGTIVHSAARTIDWLLVGTLALGSAPATVATLVVLSHFDLNGATAQHALTVALGGVLLVTASFLLAGRKIRERYAGRLNGLDPRYTRLLTVVLGLVMGALVTATSVGAGAIGVTVLLMLHPKMPPGRVVGVGHCACSAADAPCRRRPLVSRLGRLEPARQFIDRIDTGHHPWAAIWRRARVTPWCVSRLPACS